MTFFPLGELYHVVFISYNTEYCPHCEHKLSFKIFYLVVKFCNVREPGWERAPGGWVPSGVLGTDALVVTDQSTCREEPMYKGKKIFFFVWFVFIREWLALIPSFSCWAPKKMLVSYNSYRTEEMSVPCQPQALVLGERSPKHTNCCCQMLFGGVCPWMSSENAGNTQKAE